MNEASSFRHTLSTHGIGTVPVAIDRGRAGGRDLPRPQRCFPLADLFPFLLELGSQDWDQHAFYHEAARVSAAAVRTAAAVESSATAEGPICSRIPQSRVLGPIVPDRPALFGSVVRSQDRDGAVRVRGHARPLRPRSISGARCPLRLGGADGVLLQDPCTRFPVSSGMTWFMSTAHIPWAVHAFLRGFRAPRAHAGGGVCLALMLPRRRGLPARRHGDVLRFLHCLGLPGTASRGPREFSACWSLSCSDSGRRNSSLRRAHARASAAHR